MSDIGKTARDRAAALAGPHVAYLEGSLTHDLATLVGCSCGFRCKTQHPDDEFAWHVAAMRAAGGTTKDPQ